VPCSRASRSSVPSSIPPGEHGKEGGTEVVPLPVLMAGLVRRVFWGDSPSGRGQFARVILTGWVLTLAQAALAALGQVRA
jgi:hypothetical protein